MCSFIIFAGYFLVYSFYTKAIPIRSDPSEPVSHLGLAFLCFSMFLSGAGGAGGLSASVNSAAKSFSDKTRATASGLVLAGFGLSAFMFSSIGHLLFEGDAGGLLLLLSFGTGVPMFIGSFLVRPVPPASSQTTDGYEPVSDEVDDEISNRYSRSGSVELARSQSPAARVRPGHAPHASQSSSKYLGDGKKSKFLAFYTPLDLARSYDFWLLFIILALTCGTGLMYINNVGTVALALARQGSLTYDGRVVSGWQAKQVATVSMWNCMGRILGGEWHILNLVGKRCLMLRQVSFPTSAAPSST